MFLTLLRENVLVCLALGTGLLSLHDFVSFCIHHLENAGSLSHVDLLSIRWKALPYTPGRMRVGKAINVIMYKFRPCKFPEWSHGSIF